MNKKVRGITSGGAGGGSKVGGRETMALPMPKVGPKHMPDITRGHNGGGGLATKGTSSKSSGY